MNGMSRVLAIGFVAGSLCSGCGLAPGPDYGEEVAPPLPDVVELDSGPYYHYRDYHYRYENDRWHYARDRNGPWRDLPRSHYPREVHSHGGEGQVHGEGQGGAVGHEGGMGHGGGMSHGGGAGHGHER